MGTHCNIIFLIFYNLILIMFKLEIFSYYELSVFFFVISEY